MLKIDKGIPIPTVTRQSGTKYDFASMEPGDSIWIDHDDMTAEQKSDHDRVRKQVYNSAREWARRNSKPWKFVAVAREEDRDNDMPSVVPPDYKHEPIIKVSGVRLWRSE